MHTQSAIPNRVRVLVLGGGIHGVGVLHDMASRGWVDSILIERRKLASGTSSRSTKLIHGGLRYLRNPYDYGLVSEALHERQLLMRYASDLVKPIEFCLPVMRGAGMPAWMIRSGLLLYDFLAGSSRIAWNRTMQNQEVGEKLPNLNQDQLVKAFSFWDCQTDDVALTQRVAQSAQMLGASVFEHTEAESIKSDGEGWVVTLRTAEGHRQEVSALYVVNALGPWANLFLESNQLRPKFEGVNSKGVHLILPDIGHEIGAFLQSPKDGRIFFMLPWMGKTLIGTTEDDFVQHPDQLAVSEVEVRYLLDRANSYLKRAFRESEVEHVFAGLRWLHRDPSKSLKDTSRTHAIATHSGSGRGQVLTLYGGKLSGYRGLAEEIGDKICKHYGEMRYSETHLSHAWKHPKEDAARVVIEDRFGVGGEAYTPRSKDD